MNTLRDIVEQYGILPYKVAYTYVDVAQRYIKNSYSGWPNAPYRTGNLYRKVGSYNTAQKMVTKKGRTFSITMQFAPPEATYGYFVHTGTGTNVYKGPRPYAQLAANSPEVKREIQDYQRMLVGDVNIGLNSEVNLIFGKYLKKK